jgi:hypothetical protein
MIIDYFHLREENEDRGSSKKQSGIVHLHFANSHGRLWPHASPNNLYGAFFAALKKIGYSAAFRLKDRACLRKMARLAAFFRQALVKRTGGPSLYPINSSPVLLCPFKPPLTLFLLIL